MKPQLLCPAGDLKKLKIAINYGADAVYAGISHFSLRSRASRSFDPESFAEGVAYAHDRGKKLFATINAFPFNNQINQVAKHIEKLTDYGVDAFIIATIGVLKLARKIAPHIPVHLSTQANVLNVLDAAAFWDLGVKRIVAAREMSLKDLIAIKKELPDLELEIFVHGSMCFAFSGRCLISALQSGRVPNRGSCANDCRFDYEVFVRAKDSDAMMRLEEEPGIGTHIFNSKDLNLSQHLDEILGSNAISALKIEGRTKSSFYAGLTARTYRQAIDDFFAQNLRPELYAHELSSLKHRGFTDGYIIHRPYEKLDTQNHASAISEGAFQVCGEVAENGREFACKYTILPGEELEIITPADFEVQAVNNEIGEIFAREEILPPDPKNPRKIAIKKNFLRLKKIIANNRELASVHSGYVHPVALPAPLCAFAFLRKKTPKNP